MVTAEQVSAANRALSLIHIIKPVVLAFVVVAVEVVSVRIENRYDDIVKTGHEEEMARLTTSTAEANEHTETLRQQNLMLTSDLLKLRSRLNWGQIAPDQRVGIRAALRGSPLAWKKVEVAADGSDSRSGAFMAALVTALRGPDGDDEKLFPYTWGNTLMLHAKPEDPKGLQITGPASSAALIAFLVNVLEANRITVDGVNRVKLLTRPPGDNTAIDIQIQINGIP